MTLFTSDSDGKKVQSRRITFRSFRHLGWGLLFALLLLALTDIYVFRDAYTYDMGRPARGGFIGQWAHLDRSFKAADPDRIQFAVFGDSQSIDALRPGIMADQLGVDEAGVFNFSVTGGKPTDMAYTYHQYIERLPNLRHIILIVNEHQFNNADVGQDIKFKFHAGLSRRLQAMNKDTYGELLTGWALRSFGMRTEWIKLIGKYRKGEWPADSPSYPGGIEPLTWSPPEDLTAEHAQETADRWFKDWQPEGVYTDTFDRLVRDIRQRDIRLTILQIPRAEPFEQAIQHSYVEQQQSYFTHIRTIADAADSEFAVIDPGILSLADFRDTNHVNKQGADKLSRYAAEKWWK